MEGNTIGGRKKTKAIFRIILSIVKIVRYSSSMSNDPLEAFQNTTPVKSGGTSFRTHFFVQHGESRAEFHPTLMTHLFPLIFVFVPFIVLIVLAQQGGLREFVNQGTAQMLIPIVVCTIFPVIGVVMWFWLHPSIVFDRLNGTFEYRRKFPFKHLNIPLEHVVAVQVISEWVRSNKNSYTSYETNLVLATGRRINVVDHGNREAAMSDAEELAQFLDVPCWTEPSIGEKFFKGIKDIFSN